jgi:NHL repeat-containing protein
MKVLGFAPEARWGDLPEGWGLGDVAGVAVDAADRVYVFHRGEHPIIVFEQDGRFVRSFGEGVFVRPHALHISPAGELFATDCGDHTVRIMTLEGRVLRTIGVPGESSGFMSGRPFSQCTHTALAPNGDIYVSDGYGNARVHRFSPDGRLIESWGEPGTGPGQFNLPHNIHCDAEGWVYVADRENHRIQVFDGRGRYETEWRNLHRPSALFMTAGPRPLTYVGEVGPYLRSHFGWPNLGPRVSVLDARGEIVSRFDSTKDEGVVPGAFLSPHSIAVDSRGAVYIGDVCNTAWPSLFPGRPVPDGLVGLHKFSPVAVPQRGAGAEEGTTHHDDAE